METIDAPNAAAEYARRLAQRGISVIALVRSYRIGHALASSTGAWGSLFTGDVSPALAHAVTQRVLQLSFEYIDRVSEQVVGSYQLERDRWLLTQTAVRASRVRKLLAREDLDADATEAALGYRLRQSHVAVIGCGYPSRPRVVEGLVRLDRLGQALAADLGCAGRPALRPLRRVPRMVSGCRSAAVLRSIGREFALILAGNDPTIQIAVGELERGGRVPGDPLPGDDRAERGQGRRAAASGHARRPRRSDRPDVPRHRGHPRLGSEGPARSVGHRQGQPPGHSGRRCGSSWTAAAATPPPPRPSTCIGTPVQYRLHKAAELLPNPIAERTSDLELALRACDQLGSVFLNRDGEK